MADVYRARQNGEGNYEVAVKVFRSGYAQRESFRDYFMTEAEKIGQFDHPNILPFLEFGEGEDLLYVVTPFVANGTLDALLKRVDGKFSAMQALLIIQQLCNAVQYAHDHNVIHGNIKPTNVFVAADGHILLSDFGMARGFDDSQQSLTRIGWSSAEYAAPEQSLGVLRRASDIYSLGVLLFRILTGHLPFTGQTPVEVLLKHVRQPVPSARSLAPNISDAVDSVLRMAMQKRSDDRFASVEEFSNALLAAVTVAPVASAVAKFVVGVAAQPAQTQSPLGDPKTRLPALSQSQVIGDPQTPVPAYLALTPPVVSPVPQELSPLTETETLQEFLARQPGRFLPIPLVVRLITQVCAALQYIHEQGMIHGNIQPSSILVRTEGDILLTNFSMKHAYQDSAPLGAPALNTCIPRVTEARNSRHMSSSSLLPRNLI